MILTASRALRGKAGHPSHIHYLKEFSPDKAAVGRRIVAAHGVCATCGARLWVLPRSNPRAAGISQGDVGCNLIIQMALMSLVRNEGGGQALTLGTWGCAWRSLPAWFPCPGGLPTQT